MASFRVVVTATSKTTYSVEVDAKDEAEAERMACSSNVYALASDSEFGIAHDRCTFSTSTEQLTADCPKCGEEHVIPSDDLAVCFCGAFGHNPYAGSPENPYGRARLRPHLIVDGVCTPEPWWWQDQEMCAKCGAAVEAEEASVHVVIQ